MKQITLCESPHAISKCRTHCHCMLIRSHAFDFMFFIRFSVQACDKSRFLIAHANQTASTFKWQHFCVVCILRCVCNSILARKKNAIFVNLKMRNPNTLPRICKIKRNASCFLFELLRDGTRCLGKFFIELHGDIHGYGVCVYMRKLLCFSILFMVFLLVLYTKEK